MIDVRDRFFQEDVCEVIAKGTDMYQWVYNHKSDMRHPTHNKFFACYLWEDSSRKENFFYMLWKKLIYNDPILQGYYCWRIIANGQVKGQNGNWHTDHGDKTVLYFPIAWDTTWGGSTYFRNNNSEKEISYEKNRLVIFDSDIPHLGSGPSVDNILRVSIAFNLRRQ
jgi:hypothetical protein